MGKPIYRAYLLDSTSRRHHLQPFQGERFNRQLDYVTDCVHRRKSWYSNFRYFCFLLNFNLYVGKIVIDGMCAFFNENCFKVKASACQARGGLLLSGTGSNRFSHLGSSPRLENRYWLQTWFSKSVTQFVSQILAGESFTPTKLTSESSKKAVVIWRDWSKVWSQTLIFHLFSIIIIVSNIWKWKIDFSGQTK